MAKWNRRQFLSGLLAAVGAETTAVAGARIPSLIAHPLPGADPAQPLPAGEGLSSATHATATNGDDHPLREVIPEGLRFGHWRVVTVHPMKFGAVPVVLETRAGRRFQVDILRRDPRAGSKRGIAQTRHYALHLANVGRGVKPTHEDHGLGVMWLAAFLRTREHRIDPAGLLTLRDRLVSHPTGRFDALQGRPSEPSAPPWGPVRMDHPPRNDGAS